MLSFDDDVENTFDGDVELSYEEPPEGTVIEDTTRFAPKPKLYRLADTPIAILGRLGKRKSEALLDEEEEELEDVDNSSYLRLNALLLQGQPISHLPTEKIFAYVGNYSLPPEGIEWIDDETCVLVFPTSALARSAYIALRRNPTESDELDVEQMTLCQPLPVVVWPVEDRLSKVLGQGTGLTGSIHMRWANKSDIKEQGARNKSAFYQRQKRSNGQVDGGGKRQRTNDAVQSDVDLALELDAELDALRAREDDDEVKTEGTKPALAQRLGPMSNSRSSRRQPRSSNGRPSERRRGRGHGGRESRPVPDKNDLDAELEAFLSNRNSA